MERLRLAVSCVTRVPLMPIPNPTHTVCSFAFRQDFVRGVPLVGIIDNQQRQFVLRLVERITVDPGQYGGLSVRVTHYEYELRYGDGPEIFRFDWHPDSRSPVITPHVHVNAQIGAVSLYRRHLPTGFVTLPSIVRAMIEEFGVRPMKEHWRTDLEVLERELER